jgi:MoaA/NifB/PqqE/SkfB family radical SAM enzyme
MRNPDKTDFCYYPFFQVLISAEGKYKPCSKHDDFITHEGKELRVGEASVNDAWNSDYMQTMRSNFHNEIRTKGCRQCWREQALGLKPMRYDSYNYGIPESQVTSHTSPMRVEINASNVCNMRCRICSPRASSKWIKEAKELLGEVEDIHYNLVPDNVAIIKDWIPNMTEIGYFGGEPLLSDENLEILRYCVETGHSKHITILLNTNGTVYTDEIAQLFSQFRKVFLNFSIDDIGARFEYQRKGGNFNEVMENMRKFIAHGGYTADDVIECKICCTVTSMNIFYFPEYFDYMNTNFPGLPVFWNLLYEPVALSIQILPVEVKDQLKERLRTYVKTSYEMTERRTKTVENLITYLDAHEDAKFDEFFMAIARHDKYRQESFPELFSEFWSLIQKYKPAYIDMYSTSGAVLS